ncbi:histidine phosphotransferase family protein [Roseovarius sp.]|uniref:histidine phosphotransferase family protein n=1 Tax=Roseovarius sp. TaxID=1486281 RepID=UPI003A981F3C
MTQHSQPLGPLIASRICHDLVSPLGAIANGLELLQLSGAPDSAEMALIRTSAAQALARMRLFRLAFGPTEADQIIRAQDIQDILDAVHAEGRITLDLHLTKDIPSPVAQALLLTILCVEQALPYGGTLTVSHPHDSWQITATSSRLMPDHALWDALSGVVSWPETIPSQIHFMVLEQCLKSLESQIEKHLTETELRVSF